MKAASTAMTQSLRLKSVPRSRLSLQQTEWGPFPVWTHYFIDCTTAFEHGLAYSRETSKKFWTRSIRNHGYRQGEVGISHGGLTLVLFGWEGRRLSWDVGLMVRQVWPHYLWHWLRVESDITEIIYAPLRKSLEGFEAVSITFAGQWRFGICGKPPLFGMNNTSSEFFQHTIYQKITLKEWKLIWMISPEALKGIQHAKSF